MLLLLLELVELLSGLGVAIVVLDSSGSVQAAMRSNSALSWLQTGHCVTERGRCDKGHVLSLLPSVTSEKEEILRVQCLHYIFSHLYNPAQRTLDPIYIQDPHIKSYQMPINDIV